MSGTRIEINVVADKRQEGEKSDAVHGDIVNARVEVLNEIFCCDGMSFLLRNGTAEAGENYAPEDDHRRVRIGWTRLYARDYQQSLGAVAIGIPHEQYDEATTQPVVWEIDYCPCCGSKVELVLRHAIVRSKRTVEEEVEVRP